MNSVKANVETLNHANTEPSQKYTSGRCRDYRRTRVSLITGQSVPPHTVGEDIVHANTKVSDFHADEYAFNAGLVTYRLLSYAGGEILGHDMFAVLGDVSGVSSSSSS